MANLVRGPNYSEADELRFGLRNQQNPPRQGAVVERRRSSSGATNCRQRNLGKNLPLLNSNA
jgi:hypothetical protein